MLDPNNPRFWSEKSARDVPDRKVPEPNHQASALEAISEHGVEELLTSILRNGFLPLDRIVVRPIEGHPDKYVVVEGNRRLAALKTLRRRIDDGIVNEPGIDEEYLAALKASTDNFSVLIYQGGEGEQVAWTFQGIRHISGIRSWQPAQQGKLVADLIDRDGLGFREAGQRLGLTPAAVGKRYRAYKALEQMRDDEEYRDRADNRFYSLFEESLSTQSVKAWLGWSDNDFKFHNRDQVRQFYSWIVPDEDNEEKKRRLHDPRHIKKLGSLIAGQHTTLLDQVDSHNISIETAFEKARETGPRHDWKSAVEDAALLLKDIPQSAIAEAPVEISTALDEVVKVIENIKRMAVAVSQGRPPQL
jgi:hypothetical protein